MRQRINDAVKTAMKSGDKAPPLDAAPDHGRDQGPRARHRRRRRRPRSATPEIVVILQKMVKQRRESIATYEKAGRQDLADQEKAEIAVIEDYLPKQMGEAEAKAAVAALIAELGAAGPKDMGRVMGALKERYAGHHGLRQGERGGEGAAEVGSRQ